MTKIYDLGKEYKRSKEIGTSKTNYILDLKSKEAQNPDANIPFISLKNVLLRPNVDIGDPYDNVSQANDAEVS